jgi:DNA-binding transcriptional regulator LsrR (DeoR family)
MAEIKRHARLQKAMDEIEIGPEKESLAGQWAMAQRIIEKYGLDKVSVGVH